MYNLGINKCIKQGNGMRYSVVLILALLFLPILSNAQKIISGTITNTTTGKTIAGVEVKIKHYDRGTYSDKKGRFELQIPDTIQDIEFKDFYGYKITEIRIQNDTVYNIFLRDLSTEELYSLSLEELTNLKVTSVGFFEMPKFKTPGYSVIVDLNKKKHPAHSLHDIINMENPGQFSGYHQRHGSLHGVRGVLIDNSAKTMVMLDGQHINPRMHFGYSIGMLSPLMGDYQRLEFINGPGAIMHGSGAINGFINILPKTGKDNPGLIADCKYGAAENLAKFEAGYGKQYGKDKHFYLYSGLFLAEGFEPDSIYMADKPEYRINAYGYDGLNSKLSANWTHKKLSVNTFYYNLSPNKGNAEEPEYFNNTSAGIRPKYVLNIGQKSEMIVSVSAILFDYYDRYLRDTNDIINRGGSEAHFELKTIFKTLKIDNHSFAVGGVWGNKKFRDKKQYFGGNAQDGFESLDTKWDELGIFTEDIWIPYDKLTISFGARLDKYILHDFTGWAFPEGSAKQPDLPAHFSPRVAAAFELNKTNIIKVSYQHGFRMPDASYYNSSAIINTAARERGYKTYPLHPESMNSYELNYSTMLAPLLNINVNLFINNFKDQLQWNNVYDRWPKAEADSIIAATEWWGFFANVAERSNAFGGEFVADYKVFKGSSIQLSYSYAKLSKELPQRFPQHLIKVNWKSTFYKEKAELVVNYIFTSPLDTISNPANLHIAYQKPNHIVNASIYFNPIPKFSMYFKAHNILMNKVPPYTFNLDSPQQGYLGSETIRIYLGYRVVF